MKPKRIGKDEIVKPVVYKKKKFNFKDCLDSAILIMAMFAPSILAKDVPSYAKQEKNTELVRELSQDEVDSTYRNIYEYELVDKPVISLLSKLPAKKYIASWQKEIKVNMFLEVNSQTKKLLKETVDFFNLVNEKTYTNLPKIVLNYSPKEIEKYNIFKINVNWGDLPKNTLGLTGQTALPTTKGESIIASSITMSNQLRVLPEAFCSVFIHELLHALFNFQDVYLLEGNTTKSLMGYYGAEGNGDFLSLNDIYLMNIASWTKELTSQQKKDVKEFYTEYEKLYNSCNGKIISLLHEKIQNQDTLEN